MGIAYKIKNSRFGKRYLQYGPLAVFAKKSYRLMRAIYLDKKNKVKGCVYELIVKTWEENFYNNGEEAMAAVPVIDNYDEISVDIIVPVFNGYDYLEKLFVGLNRTGSDCRIILIDDASTDSRVEMALESFAYNNPKVILLKNDENLGFVGTVNRGFKESKGHVVLLNTDTELPEGWIPRLMAPILANPMVATATPYSNSATIFSFPNIGVNNRIYRGLDVNTIDESFRLVKPRYISVPSGVGFCMAINKKALDAVGHFDAETFGKGYGEENDFCQRAIAAGFKNVAVENLFVYHKHGGSFADEEKRALIEQNGKIISSRYPKYDEAVSDFMRKDADGPLRRLMQLRIDQDAGKSCLYVDHVLGGGATAYVERATKLIKRDGGSVTTLRYDYVTFKFVLEFKSPYFECKYTIEKAEQLLDILSRLRFDEIYINEVVSFPYVFNILDIIGKLKEAQKSRLVMLCHDYFSICPSVTLTTAKKEYCQMPGEDICAACYNAQDFPQNLECPNRKEWIANWKKTFLLCDEIRVFSNDSYNRIQAEYGNQIPLNLVPHNTTPFPRVYPKVKTTQTLNIGLLGMLTSHKGGDIVEGMLKHIEEKNLDVKLILIGDVDISYSHLKNYKNFYVYGNYRLEALPKIVTMEDIDIFFLGSVCPETFSFTTSEVMSMGLPLAVFDIGAPPERVRDYEKGLILDSRNPEEILKELYDFVKSRGEYKAPVTLPKKMLFVVEYVSFSSRYRMEHMMEILYYQGVPGEIVEADALPKYDLNPNKIKSVIIYRCRYEGTIPAFIERAKENKIPVYYDIDDYIFDYEAIKDMDFLKGEEYADFKNYTLGIRECMSHAKKLISSTEHLKTAMEKSFKDKPVLVNRNVASAEMCVLSEIALLYKHKPKDDLVLGYFSGSSTHNADFKMIEDVLYDFLMAKENVKLMLVGALSVPEKLAALSERIEIVDFVPWQELPELIARCDINLMPLENNFFNCCKSENKWMESALVKVATIASYNDELAGVTKDGENIILCKNKEDWQLALEKLMDADFREQIAEAAYTEVNKTKTTLAVAKEG